MLSPDDPRLCALADEQLPAAETAALQAELSRSPAARARLEELRLLQAELRRVLAEETVGRETAPGGGADSAEAGAGGAGEGAARDGAMSDDEQAVGGSWLARLALPLALAAGFALVASVVTVPTLARVRETARRSVDASNLRQIGQASLIFAADNHDRLPLSIDVWDHARQLALQGGLNDATLWTIGADPAGAPERDRLSTVLNTDRSGLEPAFARLVPSWAVPLGEIPADAPATTPIAWTRGLQPDGTWAKHSPYGADGGHIVFLGGNVTFFRDLAREGGALVRFDGSGPTANLLEALPPGVRIGEYRPTEAEAVRWAGASRAYGPHGERSRGGAVLLGFFALWTLGTGWIVWRRLSGRSGPGTLWTWLGWSVPGWLFLLVFIPG
jgi:hypothetical protein